MGYRGICYASLVFSVYTRAFRLWGNEDIQIATSLDYSTDWKRSCNSKNGNWLSNHKCFTFIVPKTCLEILRHNTEAKSGVYAIDPDGKGPFKVHCDMATDGGGWTVFQRRQDSSVDFFRKWVEYKGGFGKLEGEFWLGNDHIHRMTADTPHRLRVDMEDFEFNTRYAEYRSFKIENKAKKYKLSVSGYSGNAGDSLLGTCSLLSQNLTGQYIICCVVLCCDSAVLYCVMLCVFFYPTHNNNNNKIAKRKRR